MVSEKVGILNGTKMARKKKRLIGRTASEMAWRFVGTKTARKRQRDITKRES